MAKTELMDVEDFDITDKIGDLNPTTETPEWPMYSYSRPAYIFWNGVAKGLMEAGLNQEEIQRWLQSKLARWELDGMGHLLENFGRSMTKKQNVKSIREYLEQF